MTPNARHRAMHALDTDLTAVMLLLGGAAIPALQLGLRTELIEAKEALVRLHAALSKLHEQEKSNARP